MRAMLINNIRNYYHLQNSSQCVSPNAMMSEKERSSLTPPSSISKLFLYPRSVSTTHLHPTKNKCRNSSMEPIHAAQLHPQFQDRKQLAIISQITSAIEGLVQLAECIGNPFTL